MATFTISGSAAVKERGEGTAARSQGFDQPAAPDGIAGKACNVAWNCALFAAAKVLPRARAPAAATLLMQQWC